MWALANRTAYAAASAWLQDKDGRKHWAVAIKGTFCILADGSTQRADQQQDVLLTPEYRGKPGETSLVYEADLVATKPGTDVYINGHARAPRERPVRAMQVGLQIGSRPPKLLDVTGDRRFESVLGSVVELEAEPFLVMPIVYERAFGGYDATDPDPRRHVLFAPNPVGVGVARDRLSLVGRSAPNVTDPSARGDMAAGFGAICSYWAPRQRHAGTYDADWAATRKPLLPQDFDPRYHLCAPADQQVPLLRGGEPIRVEGMTAAGSLTFVLPRLHFGLESRISARAKPTHHSATLQTVIIEPEFPRVVMVWQSSIECHRDMDFLDETIIREKRLL